MFLGWKRCIIYPLLNLFIKLTVLQQPWMSFWIIMHWYKTHRSSHNIILFSNKVHGLMSFHRCIIITARNDHSWNLSVKYCGPQYLRSVLHLFPAAFSVSRLNFMNSNNGLSCSLWFFWLLSFKSNHKFGLIWKNPLPTKSYVMFY